MTSLAAVSSIVRLPNQPVAFLSAAYRDIPAKLHPIASQAVTDLVRRLDLKNARLGPDCFCAFLQRREACGRYDCDLRDLSRKYLDHSVSLRSQAGERFIMGSNYTDDDRKNWHLGSAAREPIGEDAERLRHVGVSWEILPISVYYPEHTTSIVFHRQKRPRGHYAPSRANLRSFVAGKVHEGLLAGLDAGWRAGQNVELALKKLDEATVTGDLERIDRATTMLLECAQTEMKVGLSAAKMMGIAMDFIGEASGDAASTLSHHSTIALLQIRSPPGPLKNTSI